MKKHFDSLLSLFPMKNRPIFITGHGRSGTSWVGSVFEQAPGVIYYLEPCNPKVVPYGDYSDWFKYVSPFNGNGDPYLESTLEPAFKGLITYGARWIKHPHRRLLSNRRVVIKEVASLMSVRWIHKRFQPQMLIVKRHPCAVALSEMKKGTPIERPINEILGQTDLMKIHLEPYVDILKKAKRPFEIYGAIWGARNRVIANVLKDYPEWKVVLYRDIIRNPMEFFNELFDQFDLKMTDKVQKYINISTNEQKAGTYSTFRITKNQIDKWKKEMAQDEIEQVRAFVEPFDLPFYRSESDWSLD